jgi:uncharacterized protein
MDNRTYCMFIHLSVFAGYAAPLAGLVVPVVLWQLKKDESPEIDAHGKMVLNFILSMLIYAIVSGLAVFVLIGIPLLIALSIIGIVFPIVGAVKSLDGQLWQYPLMIKFFN